MTLTISIKMTKQNEQSEESEIRVAWKLDFMRHRQIGTQALR